MLAPLLIENEMKKLFLFFSAIFVIALCLYGCNGNQKQEVPSEMPEEPMVTSAADTSAVMNLVNDYLKCLKEKRVDDAIAMLYYLNDSRVIASLPKELELDQRNALKFLVGKEYKVEDLTFYQEYDSQVMVSCKLFDKQPDDPRPNMISFKIRPMRINGKWYLTMADSRTDVIESKIEN